MSDDSVLIIKFDGEGSAHFTISANKVTPMQLLSVAGFLEFEAKYQLSLQKSQQLSMLEDQMERQRIVVPATAQGKIALR